MVTPLLPEQCIWDHWPAGRSCHVSSSVLSLMERDFSSKSDHRWPCGLIHHFLHKDQSSFPLWRKAAPKHDASTPMLHSGFGVLWMQLSILTTSKLASGIYTKSSILIWLGHMIFLQSSCGSSRFFLSNFKWVWTCGDLSWGTFGALHNLTLWWCCVFLVLLLLLWSQVSSGRWPVPPGSSRPFPHCSQDPLYPRFYMLNGSFQSCLCGQSCPWCP